MVRAYISIIVLLLSGCASWQVDEVSTTLGKETYPLLGEYSYNGSVTMTWRRK